MACQAASAWQPQQQPQRRPRTLLLLAALTPEKTRTSRRASQPVDVSTRQWMPHKHLLIRQKGVCDSSLRQACRCATQKTASREHVKS